MITTTELMLAVGASRATLSKWQDMGLIPQPTVVPVDTGRGRIAQWPDHAVDVGREIRRLRKEGFSFREIREAFAAREESASPFPVRSSPGSDLVAQAWREHPLDEGGGASKQGSIIELIRDSVLNLLRDAGVAEDLAGRVASKLVDPIWLSWTLELYRRGCGPVLIVRGEDEPFIVPDFVVGQLLTVSIPRVGAQIPTEPVGRTQGRALVAVPLADVLGEAYKRWGRAAPKQCWWPPQTTWLGDPWTNPDSFIEYAFGIEEAGAGPGGRTLANVKMQSPRVVRQDTNEPKLPSSASRPKPSRRQGGGKARKDS